jgi:hypothetical protein
MSESEIGISLSEAQTKEGKYDWLGAIDCYKKAESIVSAARAKPKTVQKNP